MRVGVRGVPPAAGAARRPLHTALPLLSVAPAPAPASWEAAALPDSPFFALPPSVRAVRVPGRGRALVAAQPLGPGALVFGERPLVAVGDPLATATTCAHCFLPLPPAAPPARCGCGYAYCSPACRDAHAADGHDVLCGRPATLELDAWSAGHRVNHARVAAAALARSLSGDFMGFWGAVQALVTLPVPADADALPPLTHEGYALVQRAVGASLEGDAESFWRHAFDVRTYARLLGTLRLNGFAVALHDVAAAAAAAGGPAPAGGGGCGGGGGGADGAPAHDCASHGDGGGGCGSGDGEGCSTNGGAAGGHKGGTALFACASLLNHDCAPAAEALLFAGGVLEVRALRPIAAGEEVTISYLGGGEGAKAGDSTTPAAGAPAPAPGFAQRRAQLAAGYGFQCNCARCVAEAAAALRGRRPGEGPAAGGASP